MKKSIALLLTVIFVSATVSLLQGQTSNPQGKSTATGTDKKAQPAPQQNAQAGKVTYTCPMHPAVTSDKQGICPDCKMDLVKKEAPKVQYSCPMHPEVVRDKPGKCPKCGMNLAKKEIKKPNKE